MLYCSADQFEGLSSNHQLIDISRLQRHIDFLGRIIPEGFQEIPHYFVAVSAKYNVVFFSNLIYYMRSVEVSFAREEHVAELLVAYYHIYLFIYFYIKISHLWK